jgi:hypothetical protein
MAMVWCRECGQAVSDQAASCPTCGVAQPGEGSTGPTAGAQPERKWFLGCLVAPVALVLLVVVLVTSGGSGHDKDTPECRAFKAAESTWDSLGGSPDLSFEQRDQLHARMEVARDECERS